MPGSASERTPRVGAAYRCVDRNIDKINLQYTKITLWSIRLVFYSSMYIYAKPFVLDKKVYIKITVSTNVRLFLSNKISWANRKTTQSTYSTVQNISAFWKEITENCIGSGVFYDWLSVSFLQSIVCSFCFINCTVLLSLSDEIKVYITNGLIFIPRSLSYCLSLLLCLEPWLQLPFDCDTTTTYRARLLPFDAIRREQKMNMSIFRRSRIAVESNAYRNFDHFRRSRTVVIST